MIYRVGQMLEPTLRITHVYEGGMALVYILEDTETGKKAAAKTIREEFSGDPSLVARFRREMRIWVGMGTHPNIVRAFFVKDVDSVPFLFMEYLDGGTLFDRIKEFDSMSNDESLQIACCISEGMSHVHNRITPDGLRGILHRDLKPTNILLSRKGDVKVADFGLAKAVNATLLTRTYDMVGTVHYSSPEQVFDSRDVDRRADIYSFGAILYHIVCGRPPFIGDSWQELVNQIRDVAPPAPAQLRDGISESLSQMIMKCLAKRKEERFDNFDGINETLAQMGPNKQMEAEGSHGDHATELGAVLSSAEQEATRTGCSEVEPIHLLLAIMAEEPEPLASWLKETRIDTGSLANAIREQIRKELPESSSTGIKFRRSSRRVIGLANNLAEKDGASSLQDRHILKALIQESSVSNMMADLLAQAGASRAEIEELFDEIEGIFDLFEEDDM